ncbi:hypothetical protein [Paraburkholderia sp.]|uniref:hypothetical protein n=1 Tax=Paraburkholderia sp. TaxID=1926495 RepID=UPI003C7DAA6C
MKDTVDSPNRDIDRRMVKRKLASILSVGKRRADKLVNDAPEADVQALAELFRKVSGKLASKWLAPILAGLTDQDWGISEAGERCVFDGGTASMRYLSHELPQEHEAACKYLTQRSVLMTGLHVRKGPYNALTRWEGPAPGCVDKMPTVKLNVDTAFGSTLSHLESSLSDATLVVVQKDREAQGIPDTVSTPPMAMIRASQHVLGRMKSKLDEWCRVENPSVHLPDSLLTLVSAHLSVNRALWELCAKDARGAEAAQCSISFLGELNARGIRTVPADAALWDYVAGGRREILRRLLASWFGYKGQLTDEGYFKRAMSDADVETVVHVSEQMQARYIAGPRTSVSKLHDPESPVRAHGSAENLFLFAMATVSTWYVKGYWGRDEPQPFQTTREFPSKSSSKRAAFQAENPQIHTEELVSQIYGQMFFGNRPGNLLVDDVREYARSQSVQRAHLQQTLEYAVKKRTVQELMNLHTHVQEMCCIDEPAEACDAQTA